MWEYQKIVNLQHGNFTYLGVNDVTGSFRLFIGKTGENKIL